MDEPSQLLASLPARLARHFREGEWEAEIHLPTWPRFFRFDQPDGWLWVHSGETDKALDGSQVALFDRLIADQEAIGRAVRDAMLEVLPKIRARFEAVGMGPLPTSDAEMFDTTQLVSVHAHQAGADAALLGVYVNCDWDEHGIGVLWRDGAVLGVSDGDAAIVAWMARRAARGDYTFLYPLDPTS